MRFFPPQQFTPGQRIRLDYEALPAGDIGMSGPDVPHLKPGDAIVVPLKLNSSRSAPWRLIMDEGQALVLPAIRSDPPFGGPPADRQSFVLRELASPLIAGTRRDLMAEAPYVSPLKFPTPEFMRLLESKLDAQDTRWYQIAAALLSSMGIPRPSVADLRAGKDLNGGQAFSGSLVTAILTKLGPSRPAREALIHHLLVNSDIASWGVGMTVPEFAQEPSLVRELRGMLQFRRPGSLNVGRSILIAGQRSILADSLALSFHYVFSPNAPNAEFQTACWIIRDFGSDEEYDRLVEEVRRSQYSDPQRYQSLWRNIIWSDNNRERAVLDILLKDDRIFQANSRYSDIARGELARIRAKN